MAACFPKASEGTESLGVFFIHSSLYVPFLAFVFSSRAQEASLVISRATGGRICDLTELQNQGFWKEESNSAASVLLSLDPGPPP